MFTFFYDGHQDGYTTKRSCWYVSEPPWKFWFNGLIFLSEVKLILEKNVGYFPLNFYVTEKIREQHPSDNIRLIKQRTTLKKPVLHILIFKIGFLGLLFFAFVVH